MVALFRTGHRVDNDVDISSVASWLQPFALRDVAFARLRAHAFAEQRLLGDVARDVVARRLKFTNDT